MKYIKIASTIEAHQWNGDWEEMRSWADRVSNGNGCSLHFREINNIPCLQLQNEFGERRAVNRGDYIMCNYDGSWIWFDGKTFEAQYEIA